MNPSETVFDSTDFKPTGLLGVGPGLPNFLVFMVLPVVIAGGIFVYMETSSGSMSLREDVVPFLTRVLLPFAALGAILFRVFYYKKAHKRFALSDAGVRLGEKVIPWGRIKGYHMLGDAQGEGVGLVSLPVVHADPTNLYSGSGIYVLVLKTAFSATVRVQVSPKDAPGFEKILAERGIERRSRLKLWLLGK